MKLAARVLLAAALACFAAKALANDDPTGGLAGVVDISACFSCCLMAASPLPPPLGYKRLLKARVA